LVCDNFSLWYLGKSRKIGKGVNIDRKRKNISVSVTSDMDSVNQYDWYHCNGEILIIGSGGESGLVRVGSGGLLGSE